jgi:hypothetical protein
MLSKVALGAVTLLALVGKAEAGGFYDGNKLYAICTSDDYYDKVHCLGYIEGAADYLDFARVIFQRKPDCIPVGTVPGQIEDAVVNYLRDHPADRTDEASHLVFFAVTQAWNCQ